MLGGDGEAATTTASDVGAEAGAGSATDGAAPSTTDGAKDAAAEAAGPLLQPISPEQPAGSDPKLSDEFDRIFVEIQKIEAVGGGEVDWATVKDTSADVLMRLGKDLRCLVYWAHARFRLEGLVGLREGLATTAACVERFGKDLHPSRDKAKAAALRWLGERLEADLPQHLKSAPKQDLDAMGSSVDALYKTLEDAAAEGLGRVRGALRAVRVEQPKPAPSAAPKPGPRPTGGASSGAASASVGQSLAPAPAVVPAELEDLVASMLERARSLAASDGESATSLRLRRQALWLGAPPVLSGKKHDCESLSPKLRLELDGLGNAKNWTELLERTESMVEAHPFCLDLTYWAAQAAADVVGPEARDALLGEARALVTRQPKLPRGLDRSGLPLASKEARAWLSEGMGGSTGTSSDASASASAASPSGTAAARPEVTPSPAESLPAEVDALLSQGKMAEAVRLGSATAAGLHGRAGLCRNLALAERLQAVGAHALAFPLFRALLSQLRTTSLTAWEPTVGARCIRGYLMGGRMVKQTIEGQGDLIDELVLLDPSAAVGLV